MEVFKIVMGSGKMNESEIFPLVEELTTRFTVISERTRDDIGKSVFTM